ncbi:MAG: haloacid dehalogenase-like hydrolase [Bacteroidales bacterium]|nr:haloacid dehalogenase-like hydrolase [Bacteroidales bacterium]MBN2757136.1 haloacid dehalogenase-like hydrolase [Bacteroidales bacterium]
MKKLQFTAYLFLIVLFSCNKTKEAGNFENIDGFSVEANNQLNSFFEKHKNKAERKIAVFDGDGTVMGQTPHYLADECMYQFAVENPDWKPEIIDSIVNFSNVSNPYVQLRVKYISGKSLQFYRDLGEKTFNKYYKNKIFKPIKQLIKSLKENDFEVWIVTASPEGMYQQFLSKEFGIPITNIIGVKSIINDGIISDSIVYPVPQDKGKMEAIETFIQDKPLLVAGNSRGDKEMIEFSSELKIIVNPDEHIADGQDISISDYAKNNNWLIIKINDAPDNNFPSISSKTFGIRLNKTKK